MLHMHGAPIGCASTVRKRNVHSTPTQRKEKENNERNDISENSETGNDRNSFYDGNGALPAGAFAGEKPELRNPKLVSDGGSQNTQWDTIYYGYYPQTEIVGEAGQCGIKTTLWNSESDYSLEPEVYAKLEKARYTADGDTVLNGIKYRRMKAEDRTYISRGEIDNRYFWNATIKYHYFRYEPIRWRVLYVQDTAKGKWAQLLADKILDDRKYNETQTDITWEKSTIRSWLNGYGAEANQNGQDYSKNGFIKTAFREAQQAPIVAGRVENKNKL